MRRLIVVVAAAALAISGIAPVVASNECGAEVVMVRGHSVSVEPHATSGQQEKKGAADLFWRRAAALIIADEIGKREIQIAPEAIERRAQELADQLLNQLGDNEAERQRRYADVHKLARQISKALSIWKANQAEGDAYAREHLKSIGVSASHWEWFKKHHNDPSVAKAIEVGQDYGDDSVIAEYRLHARRELTLDALVMNISAGRAVPDEVAKRFSKLIAQSGQIELLVLSATIYDSGLLRPRDQRPDALEGGYVEKRLLGPWAVDKPLPDWAIQVMAEAALSLDSVKEGSASRPIVIFEGGELLVREYHVRSSPGNKSTDVELPPDKRPNLERVWGAAAFGNWLMNSLREEVKIEREFRWLLGN